MTVTWSIKERQPDGSWDMTPLAAIAGRTVRQALQSIDGRDCVAEFVIAGAPHYFCGTAHWRDRMKRKGRAVLAAEAITILETVAPRILEEICPGADIEAVFPGSVLEKVESKG